MSDFLNYLINGSNNSTEDQKGYYPAADTINYLVHGDNSAFRDGAQYKPWINGSDNKSIEGANNYAMPLQDYDPDVDDIEATAQFLTMDVPAEYRASVQKSTEKALEKQQKKHYEDKVKKLIEKGNKIVGSDFGYQKYGKAYPAFKQPSSNNEYNGISNYDSQIMKKIEERDKHWNLAPVMGLVDHWTGSNLSNTYQDPNIRQDTKNRMAINELNKLRNNELEAKKYNVGRRDDIDLAKLRHDIKSWNAGNDEHTRMNNKSMENNLKIELEKMKGGRTKNFDVDRNVAAINRTWSTIKQKVKQDFTTNIKPEQVTNAHRKYLDFYKNTPVSQRPAEDLFLVDFVNGKLPKYNKGTGYSSKNQISFEEYFQKEKGSMQGYEDLSPEKRERLDYLIKQEYENKYGKGH